MKTTLRVQTYAEIAVKINELGEREVWLEIGGPRGTRTYFTPSMIEEAGNGDRLEKIAMEIFKKATN